MIVAIAGGKGGVGKSTTALNLGRELDAVVVDADLTSADLPPATGADLHDVLAGRANPTDACEQIGSVQILPCGRSLAGAHAATLRSFQSTVDRLERECGRVVIDCPSGLARDVGIQLRAADLVVLVTTPHQSAMVDAHRTHRLALTLETPIATTVVNMAVDPDHRAIARRLGTALASPTVMLEKQDAVATVQATWTPVCDYEPAAPAVETFETIARRVRRCETRRSARAGTR